VTAFFHYENFVKGIICFIQRKKLCMMITSSQSLLSRGNETYLASNTWKFDIPKSSTMAGNYTSNYTFIPFKGNSALKQYLPSKPHKCGYKVFILCSNKGVIYDFEPYTGKLQPADDVPDLGVSSNIVLRLAKIIPTDKHYLL